MYFCKCIHWLNFTNKIAFHMRAELICSNIDVFQTIVDMYTDYTFDKSCHRFKNNPTKRPEIGLKERRLLTLIKMSPHFHDTYNDHVQYSCNINMQSRSLWSSCPSNRLWSINCSSAFSTRLVILFLLLSLSSQSGSATSGSSSLLKKCIKLIFQVHFDSMNYLKLFRRLAQFYYCSFYF